MSDPVFEGFVSDTIDFLWEVRLNNNRQWAEQNKDRYRISVRQPAEALAQTVFKRLKAFDEKMERKIHICRFMKDMRKRPAEPYRDRIWFVLKPYDMEFFQRPVWYFELQPEIYSFGFGCWSNKPSSMKAFRKSVDEHFAAFDAVLTLINEQDKFQLVGDKYKRPYPCKWPEAVNDWYQRKSISLSCEREVDDRLFSPALADEITNDFMMLYPAFQYFESVLV